MMNEKLHDEINIRIQTMRGLIERQTKIRDSLLNIDDMEDYYIANARLNYYQGVLQGLKSVEEIVKKGEVK